MPTTRKKIAEEPKPSANCPRLHGYFGHKDMNVCDKFYYCVDGQFNMITCPAGLVFNPKTGICTWPDEAQKVGCSSEGKCCITSIWVWCNSIWVHSFNWLAFNDDGFSHIHNCRSPYQISSILLKCSGQRVVCVCVRSLEMVSFFMTTFNRFYRSFRIVRVVPIHLPESRWRLCSYTSTLCRSRWLPILLCVHQWCATKTQWMQTGPSIWWCLKTMRLGTQNSRMVNYILSSFYFVMCLHHGHF